MRNTAKTLAILLLLATGTACQKEQPDPEENKPRQKTGLLTITEAETWFNQQQDTLVTAKLPIRWSSARDIPTRTGNRIVLALPGQPSIQDIKMGYRQLSIQRDPSTQKITGKFIEIIPDYLYHQEKQKVSSTDFSGQILSYDLNYQLQEGKIYRAGRQVGEIRPALAGKDNQGNIGNELKINQLAIQGQKEKTMLASIQTCTWVQSYYVDAENEFHVLNTRVCQTTYFDTGTDGFNDSGINTDYPSGGGNGGGSSSTSFPPPPSNIPGEESPRVDPKKMMDCFSNVKTEGAAFQVKVIVVEPLPGTTFNYGPNSFGHVAIQLTKVNGEQSVTQTIGFYGTGSGLDRMVSKSQIKNNGNMDFSMEASYFTDAGSFQKIVDFVSNPPTNYHYLDNNCAAFVYQAGQVGGLPIPNPTIQVGYGGPGGAGYGMTPAGMANALREQRAKGAKNVSDGGGQTATSKGECN